ncbi:MAG: hypothetical protein IT245_06790 [Bacteroidia bacterium]|nr:hypothetical protein [Bacteroidia bacterium]
MEGQIKQEVRAFGKLGREIKISPKSLVKLSDNVEVFCSEAVVLEIEIGVDKAYLVIPAKSWNELKSDCPVSITTFEDYKKLIK